MAQDKVQMQLLESITEGKASVKHKVLFFYGKRRIDSLKFEEQSIIFYAEEKKYHLLFEHIKKLRKRPFAVVAKVGCNKEKEGEDCNPIRGTNLEEAFIDLTWDLAKLKMVFKKPFGNKRKAYDALKTLIERTSNGL